MCWIALQAVQVILWMVDVVGIVLMMDISHLYSLSLCRSLPHTHTISLSHIRYLSLSLSLSLVSLSHDFIILLWITTTHHTHTLTHSPIHTLTHSYTHMPRSHECVFTSKNLVFSL